MPKPKEQKRVEAAQRMAEHNQLTTQQKLDKAIGKKERARLAELLVRERKAAKN